LPVWFEFVGLLDSALETFIELRNRLLGGFIQLVGELNPLQTIRDGIDSVKQSAMNMRDRLSDMLDTLRNLPSRISDALPSPGDVGSSAREGLSNALLGGDDSRRRQAVNIGIGGGLEPFIDRITRDGSVDFP